MKKGNGHSRLTEANDTRYRNIRVREHDKMCGAWVIEQETSLRNLMIPPCRALNVLEKGFDCII